MKVHTGIFERQAAKFQELARLVFLIKDNIFIFDSSRNREFGGAGTIDSYVPSQVNFHQEKEY